MRFFITKKVLVGVILALCALIYVMFLSGCGEKRVKAAKDALGRHVAGPRTELSTVHVAAEENKTKEQAAVDVASDRVAALTGDLAKAKAELEQKEDALRKARYASLRKLAFWVAGIAFLATCAAVAAAFFLPVFKKQLLIGAASCVAVIVLCLSFETMLDYIPWIGGTIVAGLIVWLILALIKSRKAISLTAAAGDLFAGAITSGELSLVKEKVYADQIKAGVHRLIQDARGK